MRRNHHGAGNSKAFSGRAGADVTSVAIHEKTEITALLNAVVTNTSITFDKNDHQVSVLVTDEEKADQLDSKKSQLRSLGIEVIDKNDSISLSMSTQNFFNLGLNWKNITLPTDLAEIKMLAAFAGFIQNRWEVETREPGRKAHLGDAVLDITMPEINWNEATGIKFLHEKPADPKRYMAKIVEITNKLGEFDFELRTNDHPRSFAITSKDTPSNSFLDAINTALRKSGIETAKRGFFY